MANHSQIELEIGKCWFLRRGDNRSTRRKTSWSKDENQQKTQPTYDAKSRNRTQATLVGGECSHHCAIHVVAQFGYCALLIGSMLSGVENHIHTFRCILVLSQVFQVTVISTAVHSFTSSQLVTQPPASGH